MRAEIEMHVTNIHSLSALERDLYPCLHPVAVAVGPKWAGTALAHLRTTLTVQGSERQKHRGKGQWVGWSGVQESWGGVPSSWGSLAGTMREGSRKHAVACSWDFISSLGNLLFSSKEKKPPPVYSFWYQRKRIKLENFKCFLTPSQGLQFRK